jgi:hypothetical protein
LRLLRLLGRAPPRLGDDGMMLTALTACSVSEASELLWISSSVKSGLPDLTCLEAQPSFEKSLINASTQEDPHVDRVSQHAVLVQRHPRCAGCVSSVVRLHHDPSKPSSGLPEASSSRHSAYAVSAVEKRTRSMQARNGRHAQTLSRKPAHCHQQRTGGREGKAVVRWQRGFWRCRQDGRLRDRTAGLARHRE